ncbi:MAG: hypothetical protein BWZ06_00884 [Bacteroidetes bacterium ADurb.BinA261]|nr:MAG: hypothetical protein BWZ06_00884 [Bacteroidetes bacterium ADurb.BinA261]
MSYAWKRWMKSISNSPNWLSVKSNKAASMCFRVSIVFRRRFSPNALSSSIPAVSMSTTGPIPKISTDFFTGSVVVPACSETIAMSCPVSRLMSELFPVFRLPKMPICGLLLFILANNANRVRLFSLCPIFQTQSFSSSHPNRRGFFRSPATLSGLFPPERNLPDIRPV